MKLVPGKINALYHAHTMLCVNSKVFTRSDGTEQEGPSSEPTTEATPGVGTGL